MSVYIFRIGHLGDTLAVLPAISKIHELHKNDDLILITNNPASDSYVTAWDVFKHTNYCKGVIFYNSCRVKNLLKVVYIIRSDHKKKILYYLTQRSSITKMVRDYIFFKIFCGIDKIYAMRDFYDKYIKKNTYGQLLSVEKESERMLKIICRIHHLDFEKEEKVQYPLLHPPIGTTEQINKLLQKELPPEHILIAIGHGSKMPAKRWHKEKFKQLCRRLIGYSEKIYLILLGGKDDFGDGEYLRTGLENKVVNLSGKTTIIESAAVMGKCVLYVGNDTGTMHLAASMGIPCIGIFSARDNPGRWDPLGDNNVIFRKDVDCAGCFLEVCLENKNRCIEMINAEEVFETAVSKLNAAIDCLTKNITPTHLL